MLKDEDINKVHQSLNNFDPNLKFTVDTFPNQTPHFLDLLLESDGISIFRKETNTGDYVKFDSYTPWTFRTSWLTSLINRAVRICSPNKIGNELRTIRKFASWNGFPSYVTNKIIKRLTNRVTPVVPEDNNSNTDDVHTIWFRVPYCGEKGLQMVKSCIRKIKRNLVKDKQVNFKILFNTTKLSYFCNAKDAVPFLNKSFVVYQFKCPGCSSTYIGKTERTLFERSAEHAHYDTQSAVYNHLVTCEQLKYLIDLFCLNVNEDFTTPLTKDEIRSHRLSIVRDNLSIVDRADNWSILLTKESLAIKDRNPDLNKGLKASRELTLF